MSKKTTGSGLLKDVIVMSSGTMVSRILGFLKVSLITYILGAGTIGADIFSISTFLPGTIYMLFAGGALNTVLVPQIVKAIENDSDQGEAFINRLLTSFGIAVSIISVIATLATPLILTLSTAPSWRSPERAANWSSLLTMTYITMPQLFFFAAFLLIGQVLNAKKCFAPMMWAPVVTNIVSISSLLLYLYLWGTTGTNNFNFNQQLVLALGSTLSIFTQAIIMFFCLHKVGIKYRPRWDFRGSGLGQVLHVGKWALGYTALVEITAIINQIYSSSATGIADEKTRVAGTNVLNIASLVFILPHSLITVSLATAMITSASKLAAALDYKGVAEDTLKTLRLSLTFAVPVTFGFIILGSAFTNLAFRNGQGTHDAVLISQTLTILAFGFVPYTIYFLTTRAFYVLEDTRATFYLQACTSAFQLLITLPILFIDYDPQTVAQRIALATVLGYFFGSVLSYRWLNKKLLDLNLTSVLQLIARGIIAAIASSLVTILVLWLLPTLPGKLNALAELVVGGLVLITVYALIGYRLRIAEIHSLQKIFFQKILGRKNNFSKNASVNPLGLADEEVTLGFPRELLTEANQIPISNQQTEINQVTGEITESLGPSYYPEAYEPMPEGIYPRPGTIAFRNGQLLDGRYLIDELIASYRKVSSWRAFDQVLGRPVLIHAMDPSDSETWSALEEARRAAIATDARFLRVLDVVEREKTTDCAYIVGEYTAGYTLTRLIQQNSLSPLLSTWIGKEIAEGIAASHALRLYHGRLTPDSVIITPSGAIKIISYLPWLADKEPVADPVKHDITAIGAIIYASLGLGWPTTPICAIPSVSLTGEELIWPPHLANELPPNLHKLLSVLLLQPEIIPNALAIANRLSDILGPLDGTPLLAEIIADLQLQPMTPAPAMSLLSSSATEYPGFITDSPFTDTTAFTPVPPPPSKVATSSTFPGTNPKRANAPIIGEQKTIEKRRWGFIVLLTIFALSLIVNLFLALAKPNDKHLKNLDIAKISIYDPTADGGDDRENDKQIPTITDLDDKTCWSTEIYQKSADFNGNKPGVGILVDLGKTQKVSQVSLQVTGEPTGMDLRVLPENENSIPDSAQFWKTIAKAKASQQKIEFNFKNPVEARYLLLYFTEIPKVKKGNQGGICNISVR